VEAVGEVYGLEYKSPDVRASLEGEAQKRDRFLMLSSHLFACEEGRPGVPDVTDDLAVVRREVGAICESTHLLDDLRAARSGILVQADSDEAFAAAKEALLQQLSEASVKESIDWWKKAWEDSNTSCSDSERDG